MVINLERFLMSIGCFSILVALHAYLWELTQNQTLALAFVALAVSIFISSELITPGDN